MKIAGAIIIDQRGLRGFQAKALRNVQPDIDIQYIFSLATSPSLLNRLLAPQVKKCSGLAYEDFKQDNCEVIPVKSGADIRAFLSHLPVKDAVEIVLNFVKVGLLDARTEDAFSVLEYCCPEHIGVDEIIKKSGGLVQTVTRVRPAGTTNEILARTVSKAFYQSLVKTRENFQKSSPFILKRAVQAWSHKAPLLEPEVEVIAEYISLTGLIWLRLVLALRKITHLLYGLLYEKKWNVVLFDKVDGFYNDVSHSIATGKTPKLKQGYTLYADPFFSDDGHSIMLEALNAKNGLGEICEIDRTDLSFKKVHLQGGHYSYPFTFAHEDTKYIMPEMGSHSSQSLFEVGNEHSPAAQTVMKGLEDVRVVDSTLFFKNGIYYLFTSFSDRAADRLELYTASHFDGPYSPHPQNPIVSDPTKARMGGRIYADKDRLIRFGQDNSSSYGNGLAVAEITVLSPEAYSETEIGRIKFVDAKGPHTVDVSGDKIVMDYYHDRFSLLAGYRRLSALLKKRKS